jgi:hypothetical protein
MMSKKKEILAGASRDRKEGEENHLPSDPVYPGYSPGTFYSFLSRLAGWLSKRLRNTRMIHHKQRRDAFSGWLHFLRFLGHVSKRHPSIHFRDTLNQPLPKPSSGSTLETLLFRILSPDPRKLSPQDRALTRVPTQKKQWGRPLRVGRNPPPL